MIEKGVIRRIWVDCKVLVLHDCRFFVASAGKLMMILGGISPRNSAGLRQTGHVVDPSDAESFCF